MADDSGRKKSLREIECRMLRLECCLADNVDGQDDPEESSLPVLSSLLGF